jgi:hypothetical protein
MKFLFFAAVGILLAALSPPARAERTRDIAGAWAGEDAYWKAYADGDFAGYVALFDPRFRGWRCGGLKPGIRSQISAFPPSSGKTSFLMDKQGAAAFKGLVITYYRMTQTTAAPDAATHVLVRDFTHTWVPSPRGWRIAGGMCRKESGE